MRDGARSRSGRQFSENPVFCSIGAVSRRRVIGAGLAVRSGGSDEVAATAAADLSGIEVLIGSIEHGHGRDSGGGRSASSEGSGLEDDIDRDDGDQRGGRIFIDGEARQSGSVT